MAASDEDMTYLHGLSIKEAAQAADVHECTIRRWIDEGHLKAFRLGGRIRIRMDDLKAMLQPLD